MKHILNFNFLAFAIFSLILSGCNDIGTSKIGINLDRKTTATNSLIFAGIDSIDLKTDSTIRINWSTHAQATAYEIYNTTSGSIYLGTVYAPGTSYSVTGLSPGVTYRYRVRLKDSDGDLDTNTNHVLVTTNLAPDVPNALSLITPVTSPGYSPSPIIQIEGVKNGDTVKLFTNNTCTIEVASGIATGPTINLTSSNLATGSYTFYAKATNLAATASACSTSSIVYQKLALTCPADFILVPAEVAGGTMDDFCVMKYEAKCVGISCPTSTPGVNAVATSQAAGPPWVSIIQTDAKTACTNLGANYDMISNPEWMTLARNIEATATNWSGGVMNRGWSASVADDGYAHTNVAPSTSAACLYSTAANTCAAAGLHKLKRTHTLSNGEEVWDVSGNAWEWVDWSISAGLDFGPTGCAGAFTELPAVSCGALAAATYLPGNPNGVAAASYNSTYNLGQFAGGAGGAAIRSGYYAAGVTAGVFVLQLNYLPTLNNVSLGFRCVYRP